MEIPARQYKRPTIKQIFDFAHGDPTAENLAAFAFAFGRMKSFLVHTEVQSWSGTWEESARAIENAEGWEPAPEDMPGAIRVLGGDAHMKALAAAPGSSSRHLMEWRGEPEDVDLWRREHADMKSFEEAFAWLATPADLRSGEMPVVPIRLQEGSFSGEVIMDYRDVDPVELLTLCDETETYKVADLRKQLARIVAAKLSENPPDVRYIVHDGALKEFRVCTLLHYIWLQFQRLLAGKVAVRQCKVCGFWEEKGIGYRRDTWKDHPTCGNRRRKREERAEQKKTPSRT